MKYRTDLAVETDSILQEARQHAQGYIKKERGERRVSRG